MALYTVSTPQMLVAAVLIGLINAGSMIAYEQYKEKQSLPEVQKTVDGKCIKVVNFKNGEAYNCEDVDVILRNYKIKYVLPENSQKLSVPNPDK